MHFDVAKSVPTGARILSAELRVRVTKASVTSPTLFAIYRLTADWGEGSSATAGGWRRQGHDRRRDLDASLLADPALEPRGRRLRQPRHEHAKPRRTRQLHVHGDDTVHQRRSGLARQAGGELRLRPARRRVRRWHGQTDREPRRRQRVSPPRAPRHLRAAAQRLGHGDRQGLHDRERHADAQRQRQTHSRQQELSPRGEGRPEQRRRAAALRHEPLRGSPPRSTKAAACSRSTSPASCSSRARSSTAAAASRSRCRSRATSPSLACGSKRRSLGSRSPRRCPVATR